jgi:hypothetical protein
VHALLQYFCPSSTSLEKGDKGDKSDKSDKSEASKK